MDRWIGKVAVVTGASSGIGEAVAKDLANCGVIVIGLARRVEKLNALSESLKDAKGKFIPMYCDISSVESIKKVFELLRKQFGTLSILINCAGISRIGTMVLSEDNESDLISIINTNFIGALICTKEMVKSINDEDAYIINVNSVLGHMMSLFPLENGQPCNNTYSGAKHALKATSEVIRHELNFMKRPNIRISSISPGFVKTEILEAGYPKLKNFYDTIPHLLSEDISQTILFMLGTPKHVQIQELIIKPVGEAF